MKAWRNGYNQEQFRKQLIAQALTIEEPTHRYFAVRSATHRRVGHELRDSMVRVLPVPSTLMQGLMLRVGLWNTTPTTQIDLTGTDTGRATGGKAGLIERVKAWFNGPAKLS